jgi:hypothetical protein
MNEVTDILRTYEPVTLDEMDAVKLMNRVDVKFVFPFNMLMTFLEEMKSGYRVLEVNGKRLSRYETLYFDTQEYRLYTAHHNGKLNRWKVRYRTYAECDLNYFEVKFKNNKGRTIKERVKRQHVTEIIEGKSEVLLRNFTPILPADLRPVLKVRFARITMVNRDMTERITLDTGLTFTKTLAEITKSTYPELITIGYPGIIIAEIKTGSSARSQFSEILRKHRITEFSISKYCLGMASLNDRLKKNNFKPKLLKIQKLNRYAG